MTSNERRRGRSWPVHLVIGASVLFTTSVALFAGANIAAWWLAGGAADADPVVQDYLRVAYPDASEQQLQELATAFHRTFGYDIVAQYRERPMQGELVNIDAAGFRHVSDQGPWPPSTNNYNVFFFGGSTAFGSGVIDEDTVASQLQRKLGTVGGRPVKVYNFGHGAFFSSQERLLFDQLTTLGHRPDVAVFLDGLNDFFFASDPPPFTVTATDQARAAFSHPWGQVVQALPLLESFAPEPVDLRRSHAATEEQRGSDLSDVETIAKVIDRYFDNRDVIEAIGRAHDIDTVFVWQPVPTYKFTGPLRRPALAGHERSGPGFAAMRARIEASPPRPNFVWCADVQIGLDGRLYVDGVHYDPKLSEHLAGCVADGVRRATAITTKDQP